MMQVNLDKPIELMHTFIMKKTMKKIVCIGLIAVAGFAVYFSIGKEISKKTTAPGAAARSAAENSRTAEPDRITEHIQDTLPLLEHFFAASEVREIAASNIFLLLNQNKIDGLTSKFDSNTLTTEDKSYIKGFYEDLIKYGGRIYPEAGAILKHYIHGDGSDLVLQSDYFFTASLIKGILETNKEKSLIGPVYIKTNDDSRIGFAINGFYITQSQDGKEIYQYIDFADAPNKDAYTPFEYKGIKARLPHRLIRVFEEDNGCKGFTVRITETL